MKDKVISVEKVRCCAICKNWYDPCNSAISPVNTVCGMWKIKSDERRKCLCRNFEMNAIAFCSKFENKM